jgi:poly-gamma-glutamate capsule biosynthesis protein CapA/YwtB (metallophosphatase superfamily)
VKLALAGDTMLGRKVAEALAERPPESLVSEELAELTCSADLFVLNLECCISERGSPWPALGKPFHFRAPPIAVETLAHLGVDCVTLANNHALDFGQDALLDTIEHLGRAGIAWTGAGGSVEEARRPACMEGLAVIGVTDHPADFAAGEASPGVAYADLSADVPRWLLELIAAQDADTVLVAPHWGPNMTPEPVAHVLAAAPKLLEAGATLVAGHSAHVFQGVQGRVLFDLGDFLDDYAVDRRLRNDLGLLFLVEDTRLEAVPLKLEYCHTRLARADEADWIARRFSSSCAALGTEVRREGGRLVVDLQ